MIAILIIFAVLAIIGLIRVGADFAYSPTVCYLNARVGFVKIRILPAQHKKKPKPGKDKKPEEEKPEKETPDMETILSLVKMGLHALGRLRKRICIDKLKFYYTAAASNPYSAAMQYGYVSAAIGTILPLIEQSVAVGTRDIDVHASFETESPIIATEIKATLQIREILYIAIAFGFEYLSYRRNKKKLNKTETAERKEQHG